MKSRSHDQAMAETFCSDPNYVAELLAEIGREGDSGELAILLRQIADAFGQDAGQRFFRLGTKTTVYVTSYGIFHGFRGCSYANPLIYKDFYRLFIIEWE